MAGQTNEIVYFIQAGFDGPMEIGKTTLRAEHRLAELQVGNPHLLRLLGVLDGGFPEERRLHERFAPLRLRGEWFRPDASLIEWVHEHAHPARTFDSERAWPSSARFCERCEVRLQKPERDLCDACREYVEHPELWNENAA